MPLILFRGHRDDALLPRRSLRYDGTIICRRSENCAPTNTQVLGHWHRAAIASLMRWSRLRRNSFFSSGLAATTSFEARHASCAASTATVLSVALATRQRRSSSSRHSSSFCSRLASCCCFHDAACDADKRSGMILPARDLGRGRRASKRAEHCFITSSSIQAKSSRKASFWASGASTTACAHLRSIRTRRASCRSTIVSRTASRRATRLRSALAARLLREPVPKKGVVADIESLQQITLRPAWTDGVHTTIEQITMACRRAAP